jgi:hypothetical protein
MTKRQASLQEWLEAIVFIVGFIALTISHFWH